MPYFLDDGLYDFSMETYMYYTRVYYIFLVNLSYLGYFSLISNLSNTKLVLWSDTELIL